MLTNTQSILYTFKSGNSEVEQINDFNSNYRECSIIWNRLIRQEKIEDTKVAIRNRKSKKRR